MTFSCFTRGAAPAIHFIWPTSNKTDERHRADKSAPCYVLPVCAITLTLGRSQRRANKRSNDMAILIDWVFDWPERDSRSIEWLASLLARFIIGWESRSRGMGQLQNLSAIVPDFVNWPVPSAQILAPFVLGVEFFGVMFLLIGFLTRISARAGSVSVDRWISPFTGQAER